MTKGYQQRKASNERYLEKMDTITIRVPKESELKERIRAHAEARGESIQSFLIRAAQNQIDRDN